MTAFKDLTGVEWQLEFDAFTFDDIRNATGIDLAEQSGGGYMLIDSDAAALVRVLAAACKDQFAARGIDAREFARRMKREAIEAGKAALWEALPDFFPPKQWSEIQSNLDQRRLKRQAMEAILVQLSGIEVLPPDLRAMVPELLRELTTEATNLQSDSSFPISPEELLNLSALGPDATPSKNATAAPENAEGPPAG
jgi:hypothetical protein